LPLHDGLAPGAEGTVAGGTRERLATGVNLFAAAQRKYRAKPL
jgi:hypothetical protein